mmetsp:Transcript_77792/g.209660  ORF Transcript_77792/g.209660 Transcript_77792/m.209660 type:complete len:99 (+) Transcript_77792:213-509(+)
MKRRAFAPSIRTHIGHKTTGHNLESQHAENRLRKLRRVPQEDVSFRCRGFGRQNIWPARFASWAGAQCSVGFVLIGKVLFIFGCVDLMAWIHPSYFTL